MTELSPDAQAVLDHFLSDVEIGLKPGLAAALRAAVAATQKRQYGECWICGADDILAIAAELDPQ